MSLFTRYYHPRPAAAIEPEPDPAITLVAVGTWAELTADGEVTIPGSPQAGDLMLLYASWKAYTIGAVVSGWADLAQWADGNVGQGNGTGSMRTGVWWKVHSGTESNPTLDFASSPNIAGAVIKVLRRNVGEWGIPQTTVAPIAEATDWTATGSRDLGIAPGDLVELLTGFRDDSATMTRHATNGLTAPGVTWDGNVVESPATHLSTTTANDMSADLVHRIAASGASSGVPTGIGTLAAGETGSAIFIRHPITPVAAPDYGAALLAMLPGPRFCYALESGASSTERTGNGAGNLTYNGSPTYVGPAAAGAVAGGMRFNGSSQSGSVSNHASMNPGTSDFWIHALINVDNAGWPGSTQYLISHNGDGGAGTWELRVNSGNQLSVRLANANETLSGSVAGLLRAGWNQVVWTGDRDGMGTFYVNGMIAPSTPDDISGGSATDLTANVTLWIARRQTTGWAAMDLAWAAMGIGLPTAAQIADLWNNYR